MKSIFSIALLLGASFASLAQEKYQYKVDIANIQNDQVAVALKVPALNQESVIFSFPKAIPGSYARKDFGRFIVNLVALDKSGNKLKTEKLNANQYRINNAKTLDQLKYNVKDTWDEKHSDFIFQPGGSNIEAGVNVVMNNHAFYGYFEDNAQLPFEITVTKPAEFFGATHLDVTHPSPQTDIITAKNYVYLADNPVIYAKPDTTSYYVGKTKINVAVFSANGKVKSAQIANYLKPISASLDKFFNGLPVDSYQFLYYFEDPAKGLTDRKKGEGGYGALEHNYSSLYYLPEMGLEKKLISMVHDVSSHEFLHIQTPLNLHSFEIENFNFTEPVMSQHLWLYEGVTEYFSNLIQLQSGIINQKQFFKEMRTKMNDAVEYGDFSMTEMSKRVMEDKFQKKYGSVYNRGALIALMLDIEIREKTNGAKDLKSVIAELSKKYGASRPFQDDKFFDEFVLASHPDVKIFIDKYLIGNQPLPYKEYFGKVGYEYADSKESKVYHPGRMGLKYDEPTSSFVYTDVENNAVGIKSDDVLVKIDNVTVTGDTVDDLWDNYYRNNTEHPEMSITVKRKGEEKVLKGPIYNGSVTSKNYLGTMAQTSAGQQKLLNKLSGK
jgi:predicted metalloprotease with PDZ domain